MSTTRPLLAVLAVVVLALAGVDTAAAATYRVNSTADRGDASPLDGACRTALGTCTLRAAVMEAQYHLGERTTVVVPAGRFTLTRRPAVLPIDVTASANGDLDIVAPMTIVGAGARETVIDGNQLDRVFTVVRPGIEVTISDLTITRGLATQRELLVVTGGGAIANQGDLTLRRVTIAGNRADYGGGVFNTPSSSARIEESTIAGNVANLEAGGVRFDAAGTVINSTIAHNRVLGSCCSELESYPGSRVGEGGGIDARGAGAVTIVNSTIVANHAVTGGGGVNMASGYQGGIGPIRGLGGPMRLRNTILAANTADAGPGTCSSTVAEIISLGHNLEDGDSCGLNAAGDLRRTAPELGAFGDHGGPTDTYDLLDLSPAIDLATACPATDQRGAPRATDVCDAGAVEHSAALR